MSPKLSKNDKKTIQELEFSDSKDYSDDEKKKLVRSFARWAESGFNPDKGSRELNDFFKQKLGPYQGNWVGVYTSESSHAFSSFNEEERNKILALFTQKISNESEYNETNSRLIFF